MRAIFGGLWGNIPFAQPRFPLSILQQKESNLYSIKGKMHVNEIFLCMMKTLEIIQV